MPIKKGQRLNPNGRPKDPPELKGTKELTRHNLMLIMNKYMYKSRGDLKTLMKDDSVTAIESMVIRLMVDVMARGSNNTFETLIERVIGKTPLIVESHNFDESKEKAIDQSEKTLLKILLDEKSDSLGKEFVAQGLLKETK